MEKSTREQDACATFDIEIFYGRARQTQDRLLYVARAVKHMEQSPLPCEYNPGILGPPTTWKTFSRQSEAIKFAQMQGEGLMVFSFEGDAIGGGGKRNYVVTHPSMMWIRHCGRLPNQRCTYEVIQEQSVCKLYFDLEFLYTYNPNRDGVSMTNTFIHIVCYFLHKEFNIFCTRKNILDLSSTSCSKFSRHLIFNIPGAAFATNIHVGNFVVMICNKIRVWVKEREIVTVPGVTLSDVKNLFVTDSKNAEVLFCDEGVYTRNRNFRLYQSTKLGKNSPLIIAKENEYIPDIKSGIYQDEKLFQDSLITLVDNNCRILMYGGSCHRVKRSETKNNNRKHPEMEGCSHSPYPEIDDYIQSIIGFGHIRCWYYFSQGERLVYEIAHNRFCYNIGREHKSNGIIYIVDLKSKTYYQKCHDPDCKEFRSEAWPLPESTVFWQNMTDADIMEWVHSVDDCSSDDDDRLLLTALTRAEIEDVSDEQLVHAAEAYEMWDELDHILSSSCSLQGSHQSSQSNFSHKSNPWERLSFLSSPGSSFFDELSQNITQDLKLSQNHLETGIYEKSEIEKSCIYEVDVDKEFVKAAVAPEEHNCDEDFVKAETALEEHDFDEEFVKAATVIEEQIMNGDYEMEFINL